MSGRLLIVAAAFAAALLPSSPILAQADPGADQVTRGKYLTDIGDCASCHTHNGGAMFAGGRYMDMPFGQISTPNITPDKETGIGNYTDDQFVRVFHEGVTSKGQNIYPAMPYPWYTSVTREDTLAIKAYLFSLPPVHAPRPPNKIYFPFTLRPAISAWNWLFVPHGEFKPDPAVSAQVNRGNYLVNGLAHCGECHDGGNLLGRTAIAMPFEGGVIEHWATPNITNDPHQGIGLYTDDQLFHFLKEGHDDAVGTAVGPMRETVDESLKKWNDDDLRAVIAYLRSVKPATRYEARKEFRYAAANAPGAGTYFGMCVSCHQADGKGIPGKVPALDGNAMVLAPGPQSVIRVILEGVEADGSFAPMPGLGAGMTDEEIAAVTNYVRQAWSNAAPPNAGVPVVAEIREKSNTLMNGLRPGGCPALVQPDLRRLVDDPSTGIADRLRGMTLSNMLQTTNEILAAVKKGAPQIPQGDLVNGLTVAYCPIVQDDKGISPDQRTWQLTHFSERVYVQLTTNGQY